MPKLFLNIPNDQNSSPQPNLCLPSAVEEEKKIENQANNKELKQVKGVEEEIFGVKFKELSEFLNTIKEENWNFIVGKKKAHYFKHDRKTKRRSGYRGVSRNGASWQVLMMINKVKTYIG